MSDTANHISGARLTGSWDTSLQQHIAELNGRFLELLAHSAAAEGVGIGTPIVVDLLPEWRQLSRAGLHRLAACPYLLLDAGFALPAHWREVLAGAVQDAADNGRGREHAISTDLVRRALVLAWHLARSNPLAARITLGMNAECTLLIAARSIHQLEALAELRPSWVRPRWENRLDVWRQLLQAATHDQPQRLRQLQLRGLQLMAGSLMARPAERTTRATAPVQTGRRA